MSSTPEFSEEELREIEAEMDRITVDDVLLQTVVTLLNLAARKAGLATPEGHEGARALIPLLEERHGDKLGPVRDTLARLQMIYAQFAQGGGAAAPGGAEPPPAEGGAGPAQQSGRLWVPGQ
jgi:hypothetical protein